MGRLLEFTTPQPIDECLSILGESIVRQNELSSVICIFAKPVKDGEVRHSTVVNPPSNKSVLHCLHASALRIGPVPKLARSGLWCGTNMLLGPLLACAERMAGSDAPKVGARTGTQQDQKLL